MGGGELVFAATLRSNIKGARDAMVELCALLSEDMGRRVTPLSALAPSALADALASGAAHFGWVSPTLVLMAQGLATVVPLLSSVRGGVAEYHTVLFTAPASPLTGLEQLRGVRAAWVAPTSASGYLVVRKTLARKGVDLATAFASEVFLDSHGAVGEAVLAGRADVGATYVEFARGDTSGRIASAGWVDDSPGAKARILCVGGPIPADMIVAHPAVPLRERYAFAAGLCRLAHDPVGSGPLRTVIGAEGFRPVSHEALAELDVLMRPSSDMT